jgi:hypothetical protein
VILLVSASEGGPCAASAEVDGGKAFGLRCDGCGDGEEDKVEEDEAEDVAYPLATELNPSLKRGLAVAVARRQIHVALLPACKASIVVIVGLIYSYMCWIEAKDGWADWPPFLFLSSTCHTGLFSCESVHSGIRREEVKQGD